MSKNESLPNEQNSAEGLAEIPDMCINKLNSRFDSFPVWKERLVSASASSRDTAQFDSQRAKGCLPL